MNAYRTAGAIAAAILAALLIAVAIVWFRYVPVVRPTVSVVPEGAAATARGAAGPTAAETLLAARTRVQGDEVNRLPTTFPPLTGEERLDFKPGQASDPRVVRDWQKAGDGGGIATPSQDLSGLSSLPYRNAQMLEEPGSRDWRALRNEPVRFIGAGLIFGVALALALFLFGRGRVKIAEGRSGETVERFTLIERANHWMTASAFLVMALTGVVILYGRPLLLPIIGEYALGTIAWWSAWLHMAAAVPFVIGFVTMAFLWITENFITRLDIEWLKRFGGFLSDDPDKPSARRFNAGQKLVFWGVLLGGLGTLATGVQLMLPFQWLGYTGMHWAQILHAAIGLGLMALIIGHIYIGTVGMEGAIDAMWSGRVDSNWAKEHHDLWHKKLVEAPSHASPPQPPAMPHGKQRKD